AHNEAGTLERRAASVGSAGISSDDPEAAGKLQAKLESLTGGRDRMKAINAAWRKAGKPRPDNAEAWNSIAQTLGFNVDSVRLDMARDFMHRAPYTYAITNIGSEIRRLEQRIKDLDRAEAIFEIAAPLREYDVGAPSAEAEAIAGGIAQFVRDGTALQIGLGKVPDVLLRRVTDRRGLRLWSGMLSDGVRALAEAGALDPDMRHESAVQVGTRAHYDWVAGRDDFAISPCARTHDPANLAALGGLVAVNGAVEVDLLGQANLEAVGGRMVSGVGGGCRFRARRRAGSRWGQHHRPAGHVARRNAVAHRRPAGRAGLAAATRCRGGRNRTWHGRSARPAHCRAGRTADRGGRARAQGATGPRVARNGRGPMTGRRAMRNAENAAGVAKAA
ncbi:hypothetical protein LCGC14_2884340, partial [marine sediment metagenome]